MHYFCSTRKIGDQKTHKRANKKEGVQVQVIIYSSILDHKPSREICSLLSYKCSLHSERTIYIFKMDRIKCWVGRRNAGVEEFSYQKKTNGNCAAPSYRPPPLLISTTFDNDDKFLAVANAMIYRYDYDGMSEREAIDATLVTLNEKRTFLESLDLRNAGLYLDEPDEEGEFSLTALVQRTTSTFACELRSLWRESVQAESDYDEREEPSLVGDEYQKPPASPRGRKAQLSNQSSSQSLKQNSGRRRRSFFPDSEHKRCQPRMRFEFKIPIASQVQSLQLDGISPPSMASYAPPSPIAVESSTNRRFARY
jgi:hypothetical protein